jgi:hypothetical protein
MITAMLAGSLLCFLFFAGGDLLEQVRQRVASNLARLPNYVCRQTVERSVRLPRAKKFTALDTRRLEVALIENKEMYSWPGAARFEEKPLREIFGNGAVGTGSFGLHLRQLFLQRSAEFSAGTRISWKGRAAIQFEFRVPRERSGLVIHDGRNSVQPAYRGSVWADAGTLDLLRLEVHVDDVPAPVEVTRSSTTIEYGRSRIGGTEFVLPTFGEMTIVSAAGEERNRTKFENCRQYVGESVVSFGDLPAAPEVSKPVRRIDLPAGLQAELNLESTIVGGQTVVGDPVIAILTKAMRHKGELLLPKGSKFTGRITRLERRARVRSITYHVVGITFEAVEAAGIRADFRGRLEDAGITANGAFHVPFANNPGAAFNIWSNFRHEIPPPETNEGVFYVRGDDLRLRSGLRMVWRTEGSP